MPLPMAGEKKTRGRISADDLLAGYQHHRGIAPQARSRLVGKISLKDPGHLFRAGNGSGRIAVCRKHSAKADENRLAVEKFLAPFRLLPFQGEAAEHYAEIRHNLEKIGNSIGPNDLIIAATARANGHTLITRKTPEFLRVPALAMEEW